MNQLIRDEMDFQQRRFYRRLKISGKLIVEFWPGAKHFLDSIPGISWEKQGNKILIKEKTNTMKTFRDILNEGKDFEVEIPDDSKIPFADYVKKLKTILKGKDWKWNPKNKSAVIIKGLASDQLKNSLKKAGFLTEAIKKSEGYALTGKDNVVIVKGSSKDMHKLRKQKGTGFTVWNSPGSKVGDMLK